MSTSDAFESGDVFWAPDPYNANASDPRPWLVLAAGNLPFAGEEYICAALTLSDHEPNVAVDDDWIAGGNPNRTSYCSPWVLATVKHDAVANPQGAVTTEFTERIVRDAVEYLSDDVDAEVP